MDIAFRVTEALKQHPAVKNVSATGSRAEGRANKFSDYDFVVETDDFPAVAVALPELLEPLDPLAQQWDRLSDHMCWMLLLRGPIKVDVIFPLERHVDEPPWQPSATTLAGMDAHFWDWVLWLRSKVERGETELVARELQKLHGHILEPLGAGGPPASIAEAIAAYRKGRDRAERRFGCSVPHDLEDAVARAIQ
ncbi:MAG: nucleotidyltransferase domain-containing protein [Actinomycetota bacterium]